MHLLDGSGCRAHCGVSGGFSASALCEPTVIIEDGTHRREFDHSLTKAATHGVENVEIEVFAGLGRAVADDLHRDHSLVLIGIQVQCATDGKVVGSTQGRAISRGVVHAQNLIGVAAHAGELQQEVGEAVTAATLGDFLFDLLRLGRGVRIVSPQALVNPLLVSAHALPGGDLTETAVCAAIDIRVDAAPSQAGGVACDAGKLVLEEGWTAAVT